MKSEIKIPPEINNNDFLEITDRIIMSNIDYPNDIISDYLYKKYQLINNENNKLILGIKHIIYTKYIKEIKPEYISLDYLLSYFFKNNDFHYPQGIVINTQFTNHFMILDIYYADTGWYQYDFHIIASISGINYCDDYNILIEKTESDSDNIKVNKNIIDISSSSTLIEIEMPIDCIKKIASILNNK